MENKIHIHLSVYLCIEIVAFKGEKVITSGEGKIEELLSKQSSLPGD